ATIPVYGYTNGPNGVFTLAAVVDRFDYELEIIENNNIVAGPLLGIGWEPDLVVTAIDAPATVRPGDSFELTATVCNQGQRPSLGSDVELVFSPDASIDPWDHGVGATFLPSLPEGACITVPVQG